MSKKKTTVRYCKCGAPLPADEPKARLCQACRQRRLEEQRAEHRSLSVEDEARRAEGPALLPGQHMTLREVARCGNAVPPPFATALVRANLPEWCNQTIKTMEEFMEVAVG